MLYFYYHFERKENMRTAGIICEYNPFHAGHKRQIDILRSLGYDTVVCVMSGNFTERGELALFDKYTRAEAAIMGGADLVLELPFPYSSFSAEGFADAGVSVLARLCVDAICFGSECGDIKALSSAADAIISPEFVHTYKELSRGRVGSAAAYFEAIRMICGNDISLLSNDILAISYIAAIKKNQYDIDIIPITRNGAAYNEKELRCDILPSASALRESLKNSTLTLDELFSGHIPENVISVLSMAKNDGLAPIFAQNIGGEILSFFKLMTPYEIISRAQTRSRGGVCIADDGCGICERLCKAARESSSFDEFLKKSYSARYTDARINRVMLFSLLGVSDAFAHTLPEYTSLLAANDTGREFLSSVRKSCSIPIITKPADAPRDSCQRQITESADSLYARAMPKPRSDDYFIKSRPFLLKK